MSTLLRAVLPPSAEDQTQTPSLDSGSPSGPPEHFSEPFTRFGAQHPATASWSQESLIIDSRADLSPAQMVERKLVSLLRGKSVPVSHMQMIDSLRRPGGSGG